MIAQEIVNFITVLVAAVLISSTIGALYASGLRLWIAGKADSEGNAHVLHRIGSVVCFAGCVFIVLFALWLMIPFFH